MKVEIGDKVRLKTGCEVGERAFVVAVRSNQLVVELEKSGRSLAVRSQDVTNYSLAARKAWVTEPGRAVGRRKGTKLCDRVSVTLRLDRNLWEEFREKEEAGIIPDRTAVINDWLRDKLAELSTDGRAGRCPRR